MSAASDYAENKILDHMLGTSAWTMPTQLYVKMHVGVPGEAGTGNPAGETDRIAIDFAAASGGSAANSAEVLWTAVSNAETWSHYSLWDASTAGNCIVTGALSANVTVAIGDDARFAIGDLTVTAA